MFKKYMKKVLAFTLAGALAFSGAQIAGVGGAEYASAVTTTATTASVTVAAGGSADKTLTAGTELTAGEKVKLKETAPAGITVKEGAGTALSTSLSTAAWNATNAKLTVSASDTVAPGKYSVVIQEENAAKELTLNITVTSANSQYVAISDSASAKVAGYVDTGLTSYATTDYDGFLFIPSSAEVNLTGDGLGSIVDPTAIEVMAAPTGWTVVGTKVNKDVTTSIVTITPGSDKLSAPISAANLKIKVGSRVFKFVATNSNFAQPLSGKDAVNLSTAKGKVGFSDFIGTNYAALDGFNAVKRTWTADAELQADASFANGAGDALTTFTDAAYTASDTIAAKAAAAGKSGNITFKNNKGEIVFTVNSADKKVEVAEATKTVKVNILSETAAVNNALKIGTTAAMDIPFKAFIEASTDMIASEVDASGNAVATASGAISIDNTKQVISVVKNATGTVKVKFVPKDSTKSGTGVTVDLKFITKKGSGADATSSKDNVLNQDTFSVASADSKTINLSSTLDTNDKVDVRFIDDSIDSLITREYVNSGVVAQNPGKSTGTNANAVKFTAKLGVPAGTYKAIATFYDDSAQKDETTGATNDTSFKYQEINVVVTGSSKDDPANIILKKVNQTEFWTYADLAKAYEKHATVTETWTQLNNMNANTVPLSLTASATKYKFITNAQKSATPAGTASTTVSAKTDWVVESTDGNFDAADKVLFQVSDLLNAATKMIKTPIKTATLLSGADAEIEVTSPITEAKVCPDIALTDLQVEEDGTGARVSEGFSIEGMKIKVSADKLVAGKTYHVFVKTAGTGITTSDTMNKAASTDFKFAVQQGYRFNYNLNEGAIKAGKKLTDVAISTSESAKVQLEDGSNIELIGATFLGWAYAAGATTPDITAAVAKSGLSAAQIKTSIDKQVNGNIELYAVWDYTTYTLSYDANGGTGTATGRNFTVAATDVTLPDTTVFTNGNKPLIGFTTSSTGKTVAGASLPVYTGTLNSAQLQAIVKETDTTAKTTAIKLYAQYGAALKSVSINPATLDLTVGGATGLVTASALDEDGNASTAAVISFTSDNPGVATVDASGVVTAVAEGTANITATATLGNVSVTSASACVVTVKAAEEPVVTKKANTLTVKAKTVTVKKGKKVTLKVAKVLTVKNAKGTVTYTKKSGNKKITIKKTTGKVTVKKGLKKGTYKVKVAVKAAGNASYKAKTVTKTFKIKVK